MTVHHTIRASLFAAALGFATGCWSSGAGAKVSGALCVNGAPYVTPDKGVVAIQFIPATAGAMLPTCSAQPDPRTGAFEVVGPVVGQDVLPGKYKVAISATTYGGSSKDLLGDAFSPENTPLVCDVTTERAQKFVIDLGRKTVAKQ